MVSRRASQPGAGLLLYAPTDADPKAALLTIHLQIMTTLSSVFSPFGHLHSLWPNHEQHPIQRTPNVQAIPSFPPQTLCFLVLPVQGIKLLSLTFPLTSRDDPFLPPLLATYLANHMCVLLLFQRKKISVAEQRAFPSRVAPLSNSFSSFLPGLAPRPGAKPLAPKLHQTNKRITKRPG